MSRWEKITLGGLVALLVLSTVGLLHQFYVSNSVLIPETGGTYIEGSVGELQPLNPWFIVTNDVNRDVISLVFSGLLRYNPQTKKIEEDLATMQVSSDGRTYTLKLKDSLFWHDSTEKDPHPVTADDVVYTFKTVQEPGFPNTLLQQNFRGVTVDKIDDRTVRFQLDEAYSFFPSNLTLGLLPARAFEGIPVHNLDQALDFGFKPIGAGPYRMKSIIQTELSSEVTLERFDRPIPPTYHLDRIVFRIFSDYSTLLSDIRTLQGIRLVARDNKGEPMIPKRFRPRTYTLPQYVALFFNLDRLPLQDQKLRLGLQLGTNKQEISDAINEPLLIDTPLLQIDVSDWRYKFDADAAQGALFASNWNLPEKIRLQRLLEHDEANRTGVLHTSRIAYLQTGAVLTLSGSTADIPLGSAINGVRIQAGPSGTGSFVVVLPTVSGSGALKPGENLLRVVDPKGKTIDSFYFFRAMSDGEYTRAVEEERLVQLFLASKLPSTPVEDRVGPQDFTLDRGMLRRRVKEDPISIRRNDRGDLLSLTLLTSPAPADYKELAQVVKEQWAKLGVNITVEVPTTREAFQEKMLRRDYDILLFGQSLLDNLDSYPYWHSSGVQKLTGNTLDLRSDAYNLSQYSSFSADTLLENIRRTTDDKERDKDLAELRDVLKNDVPAIFLYSPEYTFAHHQNIHGIELGQLSLHSDRFLTLYKWYVRERRQFQTGIGWLNFFSWVSELVTGK